MCSLPKWTFMWYQMPAIFGFILLHLDLLKEPPYKINIFPIDSHSEVDVPKGKMTKIELTQIQENHQITSHGYPINHISNHHYYWYQLDILIGYQVCLFDRSISCEYTYLHPQYKYQDHHVQGSRREVAMSLISHRKSLVTHTSLGNISPLQVKSCDLLPWKKI